jgi:hypothetical protein
MNAFWASENCDAFFLSAPPSQGKIAENSHLQWSNFLEADQI